VKVLNEDSGNEIGPFRAIEESTLAHLSSPEIRSDIYAWYSLIGSAGAACGMMTCGWVVGHLKSLDGWDDIQAYRMIFFAYAALGLVKLVLAAALSKNIEATKKAPEQPVEEEQEETAALLGNGNAPPKKSKRTLFSMLPEISVESRVIVLNLCLLFGLDALASGLVPLSWTTHFYRQKFGLQDEKLGSLFFTTSIIAAGSTLVASSLSKRFGNIKVSLLYTDFFCGTL
jgi:MFS family permease